MSEIRRQLNANLAHVRSRIQIASSSVNRDPDSVTLVAVTKYARPEWIEGLVELGVSDFGENRPQQLAERQARWPQVRWHLIGHLQRNKVKPMLGVASLIHSVDSLRLAERISESANASQPILLEVNISGEESKDGFTKESLLHEWEQLIALPQLRIDGLMTMAPLASDPEAARPVFRDLRVLRDQLRERSGNQVSLNQLSMGMSGDFEVAIQEGATFVRVGSRLFEGLE